MMPKEIEYAPPFIIRVLDKRDFGRLPMVGVNIIKSLEQIRWINVVFCNRDLLSVDDIIQCLSFL